MITNVQVQKVRKHAKLTYSTYLKTQKKKEKSGGDEINLIMGYSLVKPK